MVMLRKRKRKQAGGHKVPGRLRAVCFYLILLVKAFTWTNPGSREE